MNVHARLAQLHREMASIYDELARIELDAPRARPRSPGLRPAAKLATEPTELQRARARRILRSRGAIR